MRSDLALAGGVDDIRVAIIESPMVTPAAAAECSRGFEPWHVVHVDLHRIGLGHSGGLRETIRRAKADNKNADEICAKVCHAKDAKAAAQSPIERRDSPDAD